MRSGSGVAWTSSLRILAGVAAACAILSASGGAIQNEDTRRGALQAIFPELSITEQTGQYIDATRGIVRSNPAMTFSDAFSSEKVYRVAGEPVFEPEYCAGTIRGTRKAAARELRFQLYSWPVGGTELLAVLQYRFPQADPPNFCTSVGLLVHLSGGAPAALGADNSELKVLEFYSIDAWRHTSLQSVRLIDLTGDGREELLVESDIRKGPADVSELYVFDLSGGHFDLMLREPVRMYGEVPALEIWDQTLDIPRTLDQRGKKLCFEKAAYTNRTGRLSTPRVTHPCYPRGRGTTL